MKRTGNLPTSALNGTSDHELAEALAHFLSDNRSFLNNGYDQSHERGVVIEGLRSLCDEGLVNLKELTGLVRAAPTMKGRTAVTELRRREEAVIRRAILEQLDAQRCTDPSRHEWNSKVDVPSLCQTLGISREAYYATARRMVNEGKIKAYFEEAGLSGDTLAEGIAHITEAGVHELEGVSGAGHQLPTMVFNIENSNVGALTTGGTIQALQAAMRDLAAHGNVDLANGLKELTEAITEETELQADARDDLLQLVHQQRAVDVL